MSERRTKEMQPTEQAASTPSPAEIVNELRREFMPGVLRLTPEVEPAVVFRPEPGAKESGS